MKRFRIRSSAVLFSLLAVLGSCSAPAPDGGQKNQEFSVTATAPLTTPLDGIFYDTVCTYQDSNGQPQQVEFHQFVPMHQGSAPQSMLPNGAGSDHAFADFFSTVPVPATCDVTATAGNLDASGQFVASDECEPAHSTFDVVAGDTTEVVMVIQCEGDPTGAGDQVVVVNEGPTIDSLDLDKFVCVNEERDITAHVTDPEGDTTTCTWSVVDSPAGAVASMTPSVTTDPPGHSSTFTADTIGDYQVSLSCTDALDGIPATLQFPMHVIDCGCVCPEGYEPTPAHDACVKTINTPAVASPTVYQVCAAEDNRNYSYEGAEYPGGTLSPSDAVNDYWGSGSWSPSIDPEARLNKVGVWACDPHVSDTGETFPMTDPINEWIGFSTCVTAPEAGDYLIGLGADNEMRVCINGSCQFVWNTGDTSNFTRWHIRKVHLTSGINIVSVEGLNLGQVAAFGAEIAGPFPSGSLNTDQEMMDADFDGHIIFSTLDMIGQQFTLGENSGYHCPEGFALNTCGDKPICTLVSHVECGDESVCCKSGALGNNGIDFVSAETCQLLGGDVIDDHYCRM